MKLQRAFASLVSPVIEFDVDHTVNGLRRPAESQRRVQISNCRLNDPGSPLAGRTMMVSTV
jgi:hypothetical protein